MKIVCKNCGWSWNRNDGGVNPCKCHKCGYNNKDMYGKKIVGLGGVIGNGWILIHSPKKGYKPSQVWYKNKKDALKYKKSLDSDGWITQLVRVK